MQWQRFQILSRSLLTISGQYPQRAEQFCCYALVREGCLFFLREESKFPYYLLPCLSIISYPSLIQHLYCYGYYRPWGVYYHEHFI
ncbi:hypothetical protein ASPFODRAFT_573342 [Aspergillus luchuensis CBS 106.47]|uniref:Uncharacterized protein n=1 Tax=Aspergillus luchuensis (strain CBS 106.47) TaxID=1137211 RepID=A0A1M3TL53_ASPLC|nr:hypothetical protein ASPFODRAFT_573342 [Aspergillus luchuensis CBS 106.47]